MLSNCESQLSVWNKKSLGRRYSAYIVKSSRDPTLADCQEVPPDPVMMVVEAGEQLRLRRGGSGAGWLLRHQSQAHFKYTPGNKKTPLMLPNSERQLPVWNKDSLGRRYCTYIMKSSNDPPLADCQGVPHDPVVVVVVVAGVGEPPEQLLEEEEGREEREEERREEVPRRQGEERREEEQQEEVRRRVGEHWVGGGGRDGCYRTKCQSPKISMIGRMKYVRPHDGIIIVVMILGNAEKTRPRLPFFLRFLGTKGLYEMTLH